MCAQVYEASVFGSSRPCPAAECVGLFEYGHLRTRDGQGVGGGEPRNASSYDHKCDINPPNPVKFSKTVFPLPDLYRGGGSKNLSQARLSIASPTMNTQIKKGTMVGALNEAEPWVEHIRWERGNLEETNPHDHHNPRR